MKPTSPTLPGEGAVDKSWACGSPLGDGGTSCAISLNLFYKEELLDLSKSWPSPLRRD